MALRLYNSLKKGEEEFAPLEQGVVRMYTCGPTVYSRPHVGNYSSFLMADLLRRWLEAGHNLRVIHVKNITDVGHLLHDADHGDDKIQREAERAKVHPLAIAERYTKEYLEDEALLRIQEPDRRPRASAYVKEMLAMTKALLASGHAYELPDAIYFSVTSKAMTPYGTLSGNTLDTLKAGARVGVKESKKHPADFALWKKCVGDNAVHILRWSFASGEPVTSAGEDAAAGFPGWHIECSAMSRALLGDTIDIHTGGEDNIFPHHECEIAQSESVTGKPFVRYWLHKRRIDLAGEKMSKSLGNVLNIPDILGRGYDPMDVRYYLLSVHYRTSLKFSWDGLDDARKARRRIVEWIEEVQSDIKNMDDNEREQYDRARAGGGAPHGFRQMFSDAMDADLNVSDALSAIFQAMKFHRDRAFTGAAYYDSEQTIFLVQKTFGCFDSVEALALPPSVQVLIDQRAQARAAKDFAESDRLRKAIEDAGYEVRDTKREQIVKKK